MSQPTPSSPSFRTRVAMPVPVPVLLTNPKPTSASKPSLIPLDVLNDARRESDRVVTGEEPIEAEPRTSRVALDDDLAILSHVPAEKEAALDALYEVDLFRALPHELLESLVIGAEFVEVPDGEVLFYEGEQADAFYVVLAGTFEIVKNKDGRDLALRHDHRGAALGLFGLFSAQLRAATARAIGDSTVLQVSAERLQKLLESDDRLNDRLVGFYNQRLVEGFLANPLFRELDSIARARIIGRFKAKAFEKGESLLQPGEVANVLAVVTHGTLILEERKLLGGEARRFEVTPGQFIAITSALSGLPGRLRAYAPEFATVQLISHKDFTELARDFPALRFLPKRLPQFANQLERDVFCGSTGVPGL